nr:TetR/AcrR family transcriptional regulator [Phytoactinopolyspora alkaliphila]
MDLFIRHGFSGTTLQHIADELGLTKAAIYHHHRSKNALVRSLVQPAIDAVDAFFARAEAENLSPQALLEGFFDLNFAHRRIFVALTADPGGLASADAQGWVTRLAVSAQQRLVGSDPSPDQRIRAVIAVNGLSRCATLLTDIDHDELRRRTVAAALELVAGADA